MALHTTIEILTPAKINFNLFIQGKRPDGYHELSLDLFPVSFYDTLSFQKTESGNLELETNLSEVSSEDNLVFKAIRILEQKTGLRFSLKVKLSKKIPSGAGLGGGSGNAAGTLVAVNKLLKLKIPANRLLEYAKTLGADVPFFINPRPSLATGIGERLTELPLFSSLHLLLLYPGFPISTKTAYAICQKSGRILKKTNYSLDLFRKLGPEINDFWNPLKLEFPTLDLCRQTLLKHGAIFSGLSGSGSTLFGVFPEKKTRNKAYQKLQNEKKWTLVKCETLPEHCYC